MTPAAAIIAAWCRTHGLPEPVAEHVFAPPRKWRFDLFWKSAGVALEFEGGVWTGGRHTRGAGFTRDVTKYNEAAIKGIKVLRATYKQVESGEVFGWLERALRPRITNAEEAQPRR